MPEIVRTEQGNFKEVWTHKECGTRIRTRKEVNKHDEKWVMLDVGLFMYSWKDHYTLAALHVIDADPLLYMVCTEHEWYAGTSLKILRHCPAGITKPTTLFTWLDGTQPLERSACAESTTV